MKGQENRGETPGLVYEQWTPVPLDLRVPANASDAGGVGPRGLALLLDCGKQQTTATPARSFSKWLQRQPE